MAKKIRFSKKNKVVGNLKKAVVVSLASMMMLQTFSVSAHAAPVYTAQDGTIISEGNYNGTYEDFVSGLIKKGAGKIPVIGDYTEIFLDPILKMIFGTDDNIAEKLDELSKKLDDLSIQLEISTEKILKEDYARELNAFNNEVTDIRDATAGYLNKIAEIEKGNYSPAEKMLKLATMFQLDSGNTKEYINLIRNASTYISGKNVDTVAVDPIFVKAFKLKCGESLFAGEAAVRAGAYVNEVYEIMDAAYKVEAIALDSRLGLVNALSNDTTGSEYDFLKDKYDQNPDAYKLLKAAKYGDDTGIWTSAANTLQTTYNALFNLDNNDSIASKYNTMITNYKYCYIKGAEYTRNATITYVPLSAEMDFTTYTKSGLDRSLKHYDYQDSYIACNNDLQKRMKDSGLDEKDISRIMTYVDKNSSFFTEDHQPAAGYIALRDFGFDIIKQIDKSQEYFGGTQNTWDQVMSVTKPIILGKAWTENNITVIDGKALISGYDLNSNATTNITYAIAYTPISFESKEDKTPHTLLTFKKTEMPQNPFDKTSSDNLVALIDSMDCAMNAALTTSDVDIPEENNEENKEEAAITLTVDENGQITGDKMNEAWTVAEDGTIILNKDNKFRFEGTVADKNIQNNGEIVDGNFKNVKLELVDNAVITKGTFEDCEITTNENAVIGEEVEFINTTIIDAKDIVNPEEEEQKDNPQNVVEDTPVSENDMF